MIPSSVSVTNVSLLERVKNQADQAAWTDFVQRYGPKVYGWAVRQGLQSSDAEDVAQEVLTKLLHSLKTFEYQTGKFRAWLKTVTRTTLLDYVDRRKRQGQAGGGTESFDRLATLPARDDLCQRLQTEFDGELLQVAMNMVRRTTSEQSWTVFQLRMEQSLPYEEIARLVPLSADAAKMTYSRVLGKVRKQLQQLIGDSTNEKEP